MHFSQNWLITQKWLIVERNGQKLALRGVCSIYIGIFDLGHVKVIWGLSVHFSEKYVARHNLKVLIIERNGCNFWPLEVYVECIWVLLSLNM